jgi:hypothetical protein
MNHKIINGIKFVPMRHIAKGTAYINPEDLDTLLAGQAPKGRFLEGGIIEGARIPDTTPMLIGSGESFDGRSMPAFIDGKPIDICPDCGREYCFGGAVCNEMVKRAYT